MGWLAVVKTGIAAGWIVYAGRLGPLAEGRTLCERANKAFDGVAVWDDLPSRARSLEDNPRNGHGITVRGHKKREARLLFSLFSIRPRRATQASAGVKGAKGQICLGSLYLCFPVFCFYQVCVVYPPRVGSRTKNGTNQVTSDRQEISLRATYTPTTSLWVYARSPAPAVLMPWPTPIPNNADRNPFHRPY